MQFIKTRDNFPMSAAVVHEGKVLETVLTGIPDGYDKPIDGGVAAEMREIFRQLDAILVEVSLEKTSICSARLYLQHVNRDIAEVNKVYQEYFGSHAPNRRAYGVDLQVGMLIEAAFIAEIPNG
jgi:2-iminobutanoate/2-iminopropanoate deaminase